MHTTHFIANGATPGLQTAYYDLADGDGGETYLFVHGFTGSKLDFSDQLPWFAQTGRALAYDQRGHGESSNCGTYTLYALVADLFGFLDALEIERCHVLGHSLGGMVVMRALLASPDRFASAILMDTAPHPLELFDAGVRKSLATIVADGGCQALLPGMRGQPQNASVKRGIEYLGEAEHWRRIRVKLEQMDPAAFVELSAALADHAPVTDALSQLDLPVTVVVGAEDTPFVAPSKEMTARLPNARLAVVEDAGHSPQYENALVWRDVVEAHFAEHG